jgi:hypothetical protein
MHVGCGKGRVGLGNSGGEGSVQTCVRAITSDVARWDVGRAGSATDPAVSLLAGAGGRHEP